MKVTPATLQNGGASFRATHWETIADCALEDEQGADALAQVCRDYWPPLYGFVRRRGYSRSDAQDLVQGFFAAFLRNKAYVQADRRKGKFRAFLLASLKHYLANARDRDCALKRGGDRTFVLLDEEMEAIESLYVSESSLTTLEEEQHYEQWWAATLVTRALARLGSEFAIGQKEQLFTELNPFLCGGVGLPSQDEIARRLGMPVNTLRSHLSRLRTRYGELLREEVARTIGTADDLEGELRHFRKILAEG